MDENTKTVFGGTEKPAISSRALAPAWPSGNHGHLLVKLRKVIADLGEPLRAEDVAIRHLKGKAKRWREVLLTEAGANAVLDAVADSPFPQMREFAEKARAIVAERFAAAGPDKGADELDALRAANVGLADDLAQTQTALAHMEEDRDSCKAEAAEWKAKWERALKEKDSQAEFDRQRILNLEAALDAMEEGAPEEEDEERARARSEHWDETSDLIRSADAAAARIARDMAATAELLASHGVPRAAAAILAVDAHHGFGEGGLAAALQRLA